MPSLQVVNEKMTYVQALRAIEGAYGCKLVVMPGTYTYGRIGSSVPVWWVRFVEEAHRNEWSGMKDQYYLRLGEDMMEYDKAMAECLRYWEEDLDLWMSLSA